MQRRKTIETKLLAGGLTLALLLATAGIASAQGSYATRLRKPPKHPSLAAPGECARPRTDSLPTPPVSAGPSTGDPTSFTISGVPAMHMTPSDVGAGAGGPGASLPGPGVAMQPRRGACEAAQCNAKVRTARPPQIVEPPVVPVPPPGIPGP